MKRLTTALFSLLLTCAGLPLLAQSPGPVEKSVLIPTGSTWKYLADGSDQGTAWRQGGFNDERWSVGRSKFGFGEGDEATVLPAGNAIPESRFTTYYFRQQFVVNSEKPFNAALIRLLRDDGAVIYLNGTEVVRDNLPTGAITSATRALVAVSGDDERRFFERPIPASLIRPGTNLIAVEIHQVGPESNDLGFNLQLEATRTAPSNALPIVRITAPASNSAHPSGTTVRINVRAEDPDGYVGRMQLFAGPVQVGEQELHFIQAPPPGSPTEFEFEWRNPPPGEQVLTARGTDDRGGSATSAPVVIRVAEPVPNVVRIVASDPWAAEGSGEVPPDPGQFVVSRTGPTNHALTVFYLISGTASNGVDYTRLPGEVLIPAGRTTAEIVVKPFNDSLVEGSETVILTVVPPLCIAIYPPPPECYQVGDSDRAVVTIQDAAPHPGVPLATVVATRPQAFEADPNSRVLNEGIFTISLSEPAREAIRIFYSLSGTASNGVDYPEMPGSIEIPSGLRSAGVVIDPWLDDEVEGTETVIITLTPTPYAGPRPDPYEVGEPRHATIFINDGPTSTLPVVTITAVDPEAAEARDAGGHVNAGLFLVRRDGSTHQPLEVRYEISGNALNGVDYVRLTGVVTIPAGKYSEEIPLIPLDDAIVEGVETVILTLVRREGLYRTEERHSATVVILDNENAYDPNGRPVVAVSAPDALAAVRSNEIDTAYFVIQRSGSTDRSLPVRFQLSGSAVNGVDYETLAGMATIPAGERFVRVVVRPLSRSTDAIRSVILSLLPAEPSGTGAGAYAVGEPARAGVVITGLRPEPPHCVRLPHGEVYWCVDVPPGERILLEVSSDLREWAPVLALPTAADGVHYLDVEAGQVASRFYRVTPVTPPIESVR